MKIKEITVFVLSAPRDEAYWGTNYVMEEVPRTFFRDYSTAFPLKVRSKPLYTNSLNAVLIKVVADDGHVGWGESKAVVAPGAVKCILEDMVIPAIIGMDPLNIRLIRERMIGLMRLRGHLQGFYQEAISGIEIALWDLKGKVAGMPVHSLLGGAFREMIPTYASGIAGLKAGWNSNDEEDVRKNAQRAVNGGFRALKIAVGAGHVPDLASVDIVREVVGDDFSILVDAGGCYDYHTALKTARELEKRNVFWLEAPLPIDDFSGYIDLSKKTAIPIANDLVWTGGIVREMLGSGAKVIFLPEVLKAGGLLECRQIADLADRFHLPFAPHVSQGTILQFAATAHVCAASVNFLICEYWWQKNPLGNAIVREPLEFRDGNIVVPMSPGLGVEIDEAAIQPFIVR